jgi:ligand-binding sensor domain-containing protein
MNNQLSKLMPLNRRLIAPLIYISLTIALLFGLFSSSSFARETSQIEKLTHINKLLQDQQGFIWLGGQHGLTRFDGERSINFSSDTPEHPLPFNWIHDLAQDNELLLMATETNGLWTLDPQTGHSQQVVVDDINEDSFYDVAAFQGRYYFQTASNLYEFQPKTGNSQLISDDIAIDDIVHTKDNLYVSANSGLYKLKDNSLIKIIDQPITAILTVTDSVVAFTKNNIYSINDTGKLINLAIKESIYQATKSYNQESIFTVNNQGVINKYSANSLEKLRHGFEDIQPGRLLSLLHDSSGVLWFASNQGIEIQYENTLKEHPKVFDIFINANEIALFNDEIIIGSYGLGLQNFKNKVFNDNSNNNFSPKGLKITNLAIVENELFIATFDGLWQLNKQSKQVSKVNFPDNDKVILKLKHSNDLLYIATDNSGLYTYDLSKKEIIWSIKAEDGLSSAEVIDILPLDNGQVWLTTAKGLDIYDPNTETIKNVNIPKGNKLVSIALVENKIFAASLGDGIFAFNLDGQLLAHRGQGISFSGLLVDENEIWASARPGLYRLNPRNYQLSMLENTGDYSFVGSSLVHNGALYSSHYGGILELNLTKQPIFNPKTLISMTTVSGESYLLNKTIKVASSNDLITLDLASLDYRPGLAKKFKYRINNTRWQSISGSQLTLTGLASGNYNIEIMATNSLGQWSDIKAYTEINVAYPWYWTVELRFFYATLLFFIILLTSWLLYLRTKSIKHIHHLLKDDMRNYGRLMKTLQRNLQLTSTSLENNEINQSKQLIEKSLLVLKETIHAQEPDNLEGKTLAIAIPFLADYIHTKYEVKLHLTLDDKVDGFNYELRADVYKVIFEAIMSAIFKSEAKKFSLTLQEVKQKLWLTMNSDSDSFSQLNSKVNFDLASYTIRQICTKHHASLNTFNNDENSSQLVISFPLMALN